jgi:hypothetical protein
MKKPYGRRTKIKVGEILAGPSREKAFELLEMIPDEQLTGHLFSHFYHNDETIKFRAVAAMGMLGARIARTRMESARVIMRRIMWNLNDESGGIGWGSPEAMGEILFHSSELAREFKSILFSYLDPIGNFLEHPMLQRGVLWGIGTFLKSCPHGIDADTEGLLIGRLHSKDYVKRGYAVRALLHANRLDCNLVPEDIIIDPREVAIFNGWDFDIIPIMVLAQACEKERLFA